MRLAKLDTNGKLRIQIAICEILLDSAYTVQLRSCEAFQKLRLQSVV